MLGSGSSSKGGSANVAILELLLLNISSELGKVSSSVQPELSENKASISGYQSVLWIFAQRRDGFFTSSPSSTFGSEEGGFLLVHLEFPFHSHRQLYTVDKKTMKILLFPNHTYFSFHQLAGKSLNITSIWKTYTIITWTAYNTATIYCSNSVKVEADNIVHIHCLLYFIFVIFRDIYAPSSP